MIRVDIKNNNLDAYQRLIELAKKDKVFKGCGNPDDMWVGLKFETDEEFLKWLEEVDK